jgi:hypothetical protein
MQYRQMTDDKTAGLVADTWTEYAVEPEAGWLVECDSLAEAEQLGRTLGTPTLRRRCYLAEWSQ